MHVSGRDAYVVDLLMKKFGSHYDWKPPLVKDIVGPFDTKPFLEFLESRDWLLEDCRKFLKGLTFIQLETLFYGTDPHPTGLCNEWEHLNGRGLAKLHAPKWFDVGLGSIEHKADVEFWGKLEHYSLHEATMLSVGLEPETFNPKRECPIFCV